MGLTANLFRDINSALVASTVLVPQALALGIAVLGPFGIAADVAALAGLLATISLNLASGLIGATRGLVSSVSGPTLVLQSGALATLSAVGLAGESLLAGFALVVMIGGLMQIFIALSGGGKLIKYLPYPVSAGFVTGAGLILIFSQIGWLTRGLHLDPVSWLPAATALLTLLTAWLLPRLLPRVPGPVVGLLLGGLFFHLACDLLAVPVDPSWLVGDLPAVRQIELRWPTDLAAMPWRQILIAAGAFAILGSISSLLVAVVADLHTRTRHDSTGELIGQGLGHLLSGIGGGMGGAGSSSGTKVSCEMGGGRWVALLAALLLAGFLLWGGGLTRYVPVGALAGVILFTALKMIQYDILDWLRRAASAVDGWIAVSVTLLTIIYDLSFAVLTGILISVLLFLSREVKTNVIHRQQQGGQARSVQARPERVLRLLQDNGDRLSFVELRGNLFFATVDGLYLSLADELTRCSHLILDFRRVKHVDLTAIKLLEQMVNTLAEHGGKLVVCEIPPDCELFPDINAKFREVSRNAPEVFQFESADEALNWCENDLLRALDEASEDFTHELPLRACDLFAPLADDQLALVRAEFQPRALAAGEWLFREGDRDDAFFVVLRGRIDILLQLEGKREMRLAIYGPGTSFGEVAFLDGEARTATALARVDTLLIAIDRPRFDALARRQPQIALIVLGEMARAQGRNLRRITATARNLACW
jgi:SulP family sulfate permease